MFGAWSLVEGAFHSVFGIDLESVWRRKSWRWFDTRVKFLLSTDTPLSRYFAPDDDTKKAEAPHE